MNSFEVVTFGSAVLDIAVQSDDFKVMKSHEIEGGVGLCEVYGGKTEVDAVEVTVGGGGTNTAVSLGMKGIKVGSVTKIGSDEVGEMIEDRLREWGMDLSLLVKVKEGDSAMSVVLVAPGGGRSILTFRGVSEKIDSAEVNWEAIKGAEWIMVTSLGGDVTLMEDIVYFAKEEGIRVFWNPGKSELGKTSRLRKIAREVEVLVMNRMELAELVGVNFEDQAGIDKGAQGLEARYLVVTEGRKGSVVYEKERKTRVGAFESKAADETGAGDAYSSGLLYGLHKQWSFAEAMKAGAANAAGVVSRVGAKNGLLNEEEIVKWMSRELKVVEERL